MVLCLLISEDFDTLFALSRMIKYYQVKFQHNLITNIMNSQTKMPTFSIVLASCSDSSRSRYRK